MRYIETDINHEKLFNDNGNCGNGGKWIRRKKGDV